VELALELDDGMEQGWIRADLVWPHLGKSGVAPTGRPAATKLPRALVSSSYITPEVRAALYSVTQATARYISLPFQLRSTRCAAAAGWGIGRAGSGRWRPTWRSLAPLRYPRQGAASIVRLRWRDVPMIRDWAYE
jgi:hypothetical protein